MGVDYHIYIGPYVKIYNPLKESFDEFHGCNNSACHKYLKQSSAKFCSDCGSSIVLVKKPSQKPIEVDFYSLLDETLVPALHHYRTQTEDYNYLIPNRKFGLTRETHYDPHCFEGIVDFSPDDISPELALFETFHKQWIEILQKTFGRENVVAKWGVMFYAS